MPRDNDKNNDSGRGRRDRPSGGKGRSGVPRGSDKKFAKRGSDDKRPTRSGDGDKRPYAARSDSGKSVGKKPYSGSGKPYAGRREGPPPRRDDDRAPRRDYGDSPRPPRFNRDDRPARSTGDRPERGPRKDLRPRDGEKRPYTPRAPRGDRGDARPAGRFGDKKFSDKKFDDKKFSDKRSARPRGDGERPRSDRPYGERPSRGAPDRPRSGAPRAQRDDRDRTSRGPRNEYVNREAGGTDHGARKPWAKRDAGSADGAGRDSRPSRDGGRDFHKPRFDKPRGDRPDRAAGADRGPRKFDRPREDRGQGDRPFRERPKFDRPREDRPRFDRPREDRPSRTAWQEHPRSEGRDERPRRDNEDDTKIFAKRPAFGGRGAYRDRKPDDDRRAPRAEPAPKKTGERIAKLISRAGLCSRRDAEEWVTQGRVAVNGRVINSPALDVTSNDTVTVDGAPLPERERTRLFMYHKPRGLMTTHADPEGRPTVFDHLPEGLPRLISIGRLDFNTEGLLLLTNDGGLARVLELPDTGWLRRYRVRAHGEVTQAQLDQLRDGVEVDGVKYGSIDATLERDQGANVWLVFAIREGKNREVRNVMAHLGLEVNRLIRVSYGPFQLGELAEGAVDEVKTRVLREQLGDKVAAMAGAEFARTVEADAGPKLGRDGTPLRPKKSKPRTKRSKIEDRKGRSVVVQRTGSDEARARNEAEANGYGPPRRPQRAYHGKREISPRGE